MSSIENISDDKWFDMLLNSIKNSIVDGIDFPCFLENEIQAQFVGSSNEAARIH